MKTNVFNALAFSAVALLLAGCNQNNPAPGTENNATAPAATPAPGAPGAPGTEAPAAGAPGAPAPGTGTGAPGGAPAPTP